MSFLDIVLGVLLIWGLYKGLRNGLFVEIASLVALIAGLYGAIRFSYVTANYLNETWNWSGNQAKIASFLITFFIIVVLVHFAGKFLTKIANFAMLGWLNTIAGGVFGALRVAVILGALLVFFDRLDAQFNIVGEETRESSILYAPVRDIGAFVFDFVLEKKEAHENGQYEEVI
ncbi:MAG: CvpA family protein [Bacteroidota bacterium]